VTAVRNKGPEHDGMFWNILEQLGDSGGSFNRNLPLSRVGLFLPSRIVTSLLHFHLAALTVVVAVVDTNDVALVPTTVYHKIQSSACTTFLSLPGFFMK